jgi:hypothetical protein
MKFGATFSRRSVPQWRTHDLDYDEIKQLIKIKTSSEEGCSREFEANLLAVLDSELERASPYLHGLIVRLTSLYDAKPARSRDGWPLVNGLSRVCPRPLSTTVAKRRHSNDSSKSKLKSIGTHHQTLTNFRTSKDAQLLARFVNAQYTGICNPCRELIKQASKNSSRNTQNGVDSPQTHPSPSPPNSFPVSKHNVPSTEE